MGCFGKCFSRGTNDLRTINRHDRSPLPLRHHYRPQPRHSSLPHHPYSPNTYHLHAHICPPSLDQHHHHLSATFLTPPQPEHGNALGVPRYHKLEFPTYDGKEDPLAWINHCEQFFRGQRTTETDKVWLASYRLTGIDQHWYFQLEHDTGIPSWSRLKDLYHLRFGPPI